MPLIRTEVQGEPVKLFVLPPSNEKFINKFVTFAKENDILGLDVETTATDEEAGMFDPNQRLRLVQFGSKDTAWCLDPSDPLWWREIHDLLDWSAKRFVSHMNYDPLWVKRDFDIDLGSRWIDTYAMAALLKPGPIVDKDLKALTNAYLKDPVLLEAQDALHERFKELAPTGQRVGKKLALWGFTNIPLDDEIFGRYAGLDAICVRRLLDVLAAELKKAHMATLSFTEQRITRMAADMRWRGMRIDKEYTNTLLREIEDEYLEADKRLTTEFGFTPRSPKRGPWLEARGAEFMVRSAKTKAPTLSKDTLPELCQRYAGTELGPYFDDLLTLSRNQNNLNNLRGAIKAAGAGDIIHPNIKTLAAHTGRMSVTGPPMQTYKKTDPRLRGCFIARDGCTFVGADYDSQEIRIAAAFSGDEALTRIVLEGLNQHDLTAASIWGPDFTPFHRQAAKVLNFAQQYGAMPKKIAWQLGITVREATEMWKGWRRTYAGLVAWTDHVGQFDTVVNPFGRQIPADRWRRYANGNYAIQSTGRDILGAAMCNIEDAGCSDRIWLPIHDELILEVPTDFAEWYKQKLPEWMFYQLGEIPITATAKIIGKRWSGE